MSYERAPLLGIPHGVRLPRDNPHANTVQLGTIEHVLRVVSGEEKIAGGYARLTADPLVEQALANRQLEIGKRSLFAVCSPRAAENIIEKVGLENPEIDEEHGITFLSCEKQLETTDAARRFIKYAGPIVSSRRAEAHLLLRGELSEKFIETVDEFATEASVGQDIQALYPDASIDVLLASTGMNAVHGVVQGVRSVQAAEGRDLFVRLGLLYSNTNDLLQICSGQDGPVTAVQNLEELEELLSMYGSRTAGVIVEAPTNPLLKTVDLEKFKDLLNRHNTISIIDVSVAGSAVVDASPYADVLIESGTKFMSGKSDLMLGVVMVNRDSKYADAFADAIRSRVDVPFNGDIQRFSYELRGYQERARLIGANTLRLVEFFESHDAVRGVYWSGAGENLQNFSAITRDHSVPAGIFSIDLGERYTEVYDRLSLPKCPGFGMEWTSLNAYREIAFLPIEFMGDEERRFFERQQLDNKLRVSVGTENPDLIIEQFKPVLDAASSE